ncbi:hypothetical protein SmJEL517_g02796 [Synchytrium microbalum]|uniref:Structural maintenance of chromosomes protein 4 n=1 Tax=Synchytrium microbalum TaxID=1806994 RepID=A0A507CAL1_9FUNG|nr:uncharacterized protein SmJEL517_g02796 [Synchytrium microbalum]TPX34555.1 hypothetical protein SmJEL517_g02796 [Synchytrium microbalum]
MLTHVDTRPDGPSSSDPSTSSQQARVAASLVAPLTIKEDHVPRLVISKMVLVNFKSYAGRIEVGPFHKSFTSVVGPNGSGKSNVIDALLFVFGFKAKKMRQGKLSELIHNSSEFQDLESCSVEVHFQEIKDLPGPDAFEVIPNSTLIVSRQADKNNSNTYRVNGRTSSYKEVTTMLKKFGVDLDHKRFLILQGEVESIAQMKPKAQTEHEDGLLEYLEDIIGTSVYKQPIEDANVKLEQMNEERSEKLNRVKLVEKDKKALEGKKDEALGFLKMQNALAKRKNELFQLQISDLESDIETLHVTMGELQTTLDAQRAKYADLDKEVNELEPKAAAMTAEHEAMRKKTSEVEKELAKFDRAEVECQEKSKHLKDKEKKLTKAIKSEILTRSEHETWINNFEADIDKQNKEAEQLNQRLQQEQTELDNIRDGLRDKTAGFQQEIDTKMQELAPWQTKINTSQAALHVAQQEHKLLTEKTNAAATRVSDAEKVLAQHVAGVRVKETALVDSQTALTSNKHRVTEFADLLKDIVSDEEQKRKSLATSRQKVEESRALMQQSQSKSNVLTSLFKERDSKRIPGIRGRLGDLGVIDDKYDIAVTNACKHLDCVLSDTLVDSEKGVEHLKKTNAGRATFISLNKIPEYAVEMEPIKTPEDVPRLFDLIRPKDAKARIAFYHSLKNTLVVKDLDQGNRINSGQQRHRIVTLTGQLIELSGAMTGSGARQPKRGGMSSKFKGDNVSPEHLAALQQKQTTNEAEWKTAVENKRLAESELEKLQNEMPALELAISKATMDVDSVKKMVVDAQKHLKTLQSEDNKADQNDVIRIKQLDTDIQNHKKELANLKTSSSAIEAAIQKLQEKILEVGGVRLKSQKAKVDSVQMQIDMASDRLTKTAAERTTRERNLVKVQKSIAKKEEELAEAAEELAVVVKDLESHSASAVELRGKVAEAKEALEAKTEELADIKKLLNEKTKVVNKMRSEEVEFKAQVDECKLKLKGNQNGIAYYRKELNSLKLQPTGFEDDDEPEDSLDILTVEQLEALDVKQIKKEVEALTEKITAAKPNLSVLNEYRQRLHDYLARAKDLEDFTARRDAAKTEYDDLRKKRLDDFMAGFNLISLKLKEMYQMITMGGNAELELVDSLDPFSEGILFSVMPPKKSWKNISNLSGGEKTLSSLALVFALHHFKPTPLYVMDEIDAALDFRNVSIVANYIKERTKNAQFVIISLRNNMFELADRLVGIYKTDDTTKSITINPASSQTTREAGDIRALATLDEPRLPRQEATETTPLILTNGNANIHHTKAESFYTKVQSFYSKIQSLLSNKSVYGLFLILVIVVLWTSSSFVTQHIYESGFAKPYFLTYANTASFALYLIPAIWMRQRRKKQLAIVENGVIPSSTSPTSPTDIEVDVHDDDGLEPMGIWQTARISVMFSLLWFAANLTQAASLKFTEVGTSTVCSSTSGLFTYLIGLAFRIPGEHFSGLRSLGVLSSLFGVALVSLADTPFGEIPEQDEIIGDSLALFGAFAYAVYSILLKRAGSKNKIDPFFFFGFVGLFSIIIYSPVFIVLHVTQLEVFEWPSPIILVYIVFNSFLGTFLSDYVWMQAVLVTSATEVTVGLTLTIPLASLGDIVIQGRELSLMYIGGAALCVLGFTAVAKI